MRLKLFNWFIVSLVTVAVLYPAILVLSIVWQEHLQIVMGEQNHLAKSVYWFLFSIPIFLELIFLLYKSYTNYQAYVMHKKIKALQRLWYES